MQIILTPKEINLQEALDGTYSYKINNTRVEGFKTKKEALNHAQESFTKFIKEKYIGS